MGTDSSMTTNSAITSLTLTKPDDWHCHLRDGAGLTTTVPDIARCFGRAIVMPNLTPPITTTDEALAYQERITACIPENNNFQPLMTLYLTNNTTPEEIIKAKASGHITAAKLYPAGATTNSDAGVTDLENISDCLEEMQKQALPLLIHGEVTDTDIDIFDREQIFIDKHLKNLTQNFPALKIVLEHITTKNAVDFVKDANENVAATITAHHLLYNRNDMLVGGIKPHFYCLPILKRNTHQTALINAATSGNAKFFLGTDSAPHPQDKKEAACGCAGSYTALSAIELYAEAFEAANALDKLEAFASFYGPDFYGLARNKDTIQLKKQRWTLPQSIPFLDSQLIPLRAGEELQWQVI